MPENIEQLTKMKEYMGTVPSAVFSQRGGIEEVMRYFDLLEFFKFPSSKEMVLPCMHLTGRHNVWCLSHCLTCAI